MKEPETRPSMVAISGPAVRTGCSRLARPRDVLIAAAVSPIHPPHDLKTISPHVVLTVAPGFRLRSSYLRTLKACANTVLRATPPPAPPPRQQPRISGVVALVVEMTKPIHTFRPRVGKGLVAHARPACPLAPPSIFPLKEPQGPAAGLGVLGAI